MIDSEHFEKEEPQDISKYLPGSPKILQKQEHLISRRSIDPDALKIVHKISKAGHVAFLVGGCVRDLLLGTHPKDFDIGTSARPEEVRKIFRNSRTIGKRFRLSHIYFRGGKIFEVATFRTIESPTFAEEIPSSGDGSIDIENIDIDSQNTETNIEVTTVKTLAPDNAYGDAQTDAFRRDITVNAMFYDPLSEILIDYVGGLQDIQQKVIRTIGDPWVRFREDPIRMIRAIRHGSKPGFTFDPQLWKALQELAPLILQCPEARVHEEFTKEFSRGTSVRSIELLRESNVLHTLYPQLETLFAENPEHTQMILERADMLVKEGITVTGEMVILSIFLQRLDQLPNKNELAQIIDDFFQPVGATKREREMLVGALITGEQLIEYSGAKIPQKRKILERRYFPEALTLLELSTPNAEVQSCVQAWIAFEKKEHRLQNYGSSSHE
jgi:poly(A) polymerase